MIMRPIFKFFLFIILCFCFPPDGFGQVMDSVKRFHDVTDIEKRIRQTVHYHENKSSSESQMEGDKQTNSYNNLFLPEVNLDVDDFFLEKKKIIKPLDSLYLRKANGTLQLPEYPGSEVMSGLTFADTMFYNPLFLPPVFMGKILPRNLSFYQIDDSTSKYTLIPPEKTFAKRLRQYDFIRNVRKQFYASSPDEIKYSVLQLNRLNKNNYDDKITTQLDPFQNILETEMSVSLDRPDVEGVKFRRRYWIWSGKHELVFSQNYFSDNWHKGGTSNLNIRNHHVIRLNYKKDKVRFNNLFEWRVSIYNAPEDSLRKFRIGEDLLRYYGDFGVDAFIKHWSYSTNMEIKTQLFNNHEPNSNGLRSSFLSPLYINAGIGMKYETEKKSDRVRHRKIKWELALSPISLNYKYILNSKVNLKRFGLSKGDRYVFDVGSTINSLINYNMTRYITLESRFKYFTSYDKIEAEFENTFKFPLSNYLTTTFFLHMRYDDAVPMDPKFKHLQISQVIGIGFDYKW